MQIFRERAEVATEKGFVGAFPNFYFGQSGKFEVGGTIFIKPEAATWRDILLTDLGSPSLDDFGGRMRATQVWATNNGFVGGFPNFFHADHGGGIVCGTILLPTTSAEWQDVSLTDLNNPSLDDIGGRMRATQDYATKHAFEGGFPNFFHADHGGAIVCGTILLPPSSAEWQDVPTGFEFPG